jgi:hypothetical protein
VGPTGVLVSANCRARTARTRSTRSNWGRSHADPNGWDTAYENTEGTAKPVALIPGHEHAEPVLVPATASMRRRLSAWHVHMGHFGRWTRYAQPQFHGDQSPRFGCRIQKSDNAFFYCLVKLDRISKCRTCQDGTTEVSAVTVPGIVFLKSPKVCAVKRSAFEVCVPQVGSI